MTATVDMVNRALQTFGSRTTVTAAELAASSSNEAIQANLIYTPFRRRLLRLAPWSCAFQTANLTYISSVPGTPENTTAATQLWQKGQPAPPWAYEYQYPVDCLRACWVTPQTATGFAGGVPITTAVTGGAPSFWQGPPVKFVVGVDQFYSIIPAIAVASGGTGYVAGDIVKIGVQTTGAVPFGASALAQVTAAPGGVISAVTILTQVAGSTPVRGGSLFAPQNNPVASTGGTGTGATFNVNYTGPDDQRVIFTNQEFAILNYVKDVTNENVFDDDFQEALVFVLGGALCKALTGDKGLANLTIAQGNEIIRIARANDGNESLKINDVTPDWIRHRGINYTEDISGPYNTGFDWGGIWPGYG